MWPSICICFPTCLEAPFFTSIVKCINLTWLQTDYHYLYPHKSYSDQLFNCLTFLIIYNNNNILNHDMSTQITVLFNLRQSYSWKPIGSGVSHIPCQSYYSGWLLFDLTIIDIVCHQFWDRPIKHKWMGHSYCKDQ